MRISDRRHLYPLAHSMGFLELSLQDAVDGLQHWQQTTAANRGDVLHLEVHDVPGGVADALTALDPLSTPSDRILAVPTRADRWTAVFRNTPLGSDPESMAGYQAYLLNTRTVVVVDQPGWGVLFATYAPGQKMDYDRWVGTAKDSRWIFENNGDPLPWEDTSTFTNRIVRTRFERPQLDTALAGYGISLEEDFFAPDHRSVLLHNLSTSPHRQTFTLTQRQEMDGFTP